MTAKALKQIRCDDYFTLSRTESRGSKNLRYLKSPFIICSNRQKDSVNTRFKLDFYRITKNTRVILNGSQPW